MKQHTNTLMLAFALLVVIVSAIVMFSPEPAQAQFIDRILRPCGGTSTGSVIVTTTNITMVPCPGGAVTINGTAITPGAGLPDPGSNGFVVRTALNTDVARTLVAGTGISISNASGVGGNPTITNTATATPGGANTQVQFNDAGAFGGDAGLVYAKATDVLTIAGELSVAKAVRSGTASNTDIAGVLTIAAGGTQTFTFTQTYVSAPICVCSDTSATPSICGASASTTVLTVRSGAGNVVNYVCIGRN